MYAIRSYYATDATAVEGTTNNTLAFQVSQNNVSEFDTTVVVTLNLDEVEIEDFETTTVTYKDASGADVTTTVADLVAGLEITIPAGTTYAPEFSYNFV